MPVKAEPGGIRVRARKIDQRRQKACERLPGAGRRDQEHEFTGLRPCQKLELVRTRLPALLGEPFQERPGQSYGVTAGGWGFDEVHGARR
jgi:hypothetical protein